MKKPARTCPDGAADLGEAGQELAVLGEVADRLLRPVEVVVDLAVAGVQRAVLEPVGDLRDAFGHRVGEVLGAVGDLVAGHGQQGDDRRDDQHDHQPGSAAPRGTPCRCIQLTTGSTSAAMNMRDDDRQHDHHQEPDDPGDHVRRRGDDQEPPRPCGREVDAPGHVRAGEVGGAGCDRHGHRRRTPFAPAHRGEVLPLVGDALGQPLPGAVVARLGRGLDGRVRSRLVSAVAHAVRLGHGRSVIGQPLHQPIRRLGMPSGEQPGRCEDVVAVDHEARSHRQLPAALDLTGAAREHSLLDPRPAVPQHAAGARPGGRPRGGPCRCAPRRGRRGRPRPGCGRRAGAGRARRQRPRCARRRRSPRRSSAGSRGRRAGRRRRATRSSSAASATVEVADHRMPRSPSTVRVTGVVATTSRERVASSGSSSTTECTSVVAPPTSTTTTSPAPGWSASTPRASSSTPVSTTSGVAPVTMAVKSARLLRCLPPITWDRNISRIAPRADSGASTPIRGTTLSATTYGVARPAPPRPRRGVDVAGDHDRAGPAARDDPLRGVDDDLRCCRRRCRRSAARRRAGRAAQGAPDRTRQAHDPLRRRPRPPGHRWRGRPGGRPRR